MFLHNGQTYVTIVHPAIQSKPKAQPMFLNDWVAVPRLSTYGKYQVRDLLPPEQLAALARFTNQLEAKR